MTSSTADDALLARAVEAAKAAGRQARSRRRAAAQAGDATLDLRTKANPRDLVTAIDEDTERVIRQHLEDTGIPVLGEEGGWIAGEDWRAADAVWVVDPVDGTANFVHTLPHFGTAIALVRKGRPFLGVFYDPNADELFWAVRGGGCHLQRGDGPAERLSVDDRPLAEALVGASLPSTPAEREANGAAIMEVVRVCRNVRVLGSAATHLAYVAAGRLSACWDIHLSPWDMAAGQVMVEEAGGVVTTITGEPFRLDQRTIVAANPRLHKDLVPVLARARAGA
ncbi:MAG: inositol monophosphatase [Clostridia bacterium]|nr:inositol monophosphatase [Clostridia bacterium]